MAVIGMAGCAVGGISHAPVAGWTGPESLSDTLPRIRLTWILIDPDHATWRNEFTLDGETWRLIEEYEMMTG